MAHRREIVVQHELDDRLIIKTGLSANDKVAVEGLRHVRDGEKVEYQNCPPENVACALSTRSPLAAARADRAPVLRRPSRPAGSTEPPSVRRKGGCQIAKIVFGLWFRGQYVAGLNA